MEEHKYLFSIIVPVYNTDEYLAECIDSVINQTIGFENVQLILINDGSPSLEDEEICLSYLSQYPDNIVYEKKENGGMSSARNTGYKYIEGKYVNFLDGDDKFQIYALDKVYNYFEANKNEINVVITSAEYFEGNRGLVETFKGFEQICTINIVEEEHKNHIFIWSCFFKSNTIKKYYFDKHCKFGEDIKIINTILLHEGKYGYLPTVKYLYRQRIKKSSNMDIVFKDSDYKDYIYKKFIDEVYLYLINLSTDLYGEPIPYVKRLYALGTRYSIPPFMAYPELTKQEKVEILEEQTKYYYKKAKINTYRYLLKAYVEIEQQIRPIIQNFFVKGTTGRIPYTSYLDKFVFKFINDRSPLLKIVNFANLTKEDKIMFMVALYKGLQFIDDEYILNCPNVSYARKLFLLKFKHKNLNMKGNEAYKEFMEKEQLNLGK